MLSYHLCLYLRSNFFSSGYPGIIIHQFIVYPVCTTLPTHVTFLDFITLIIFGKQGCTNYEAPHSATVPSLQLLSPFLRPNILLSTLSSVILNLCASSRTRGEFHILTKQQVYYSFLYFSLYDIVRETERQTVLTWTAANTTKKQRQELPTAPLTRTS
jgi:hypothetical protein